MFKKIEFIALIILTVFDLNGCESHMNKQLFGEKNGRQVDVVAIGN